MSETGIRDDSGDQSKSKDQIDPAAESLREDSIKPRVKIVGERAELLDSKLPDAPADGVSMGPTDPKSEMTVTVMVKSKASDKEIDQTLNEIMEGKRAPLSNTEFDAKFSADPQSMARIKRFAKDNGLSVESADNRSGRVVLKGPAASFSQAFQVQLQDVKVGDDINRERDTNISLPRAIEADVQGVFGLDQRKLAAPHYKLLPPGFKPRITTGHLPNEIADAYKFPKDSMGQGQSVGILQFGGGLDRFDNKQYYVQHGLKEPEIQLVGVGGAKSKPGRSREDNEVTLDSQVIGAVAPDAKQQIIFAPNSEQGFVDAVTRATFPEEGEIQNSAISISWGAPESVWSDQAKNNLNAAFKKAALRGISVFAASGDDGAKDKSPDGKFTTDYPASDPFVTGTGGTNFDIKNDKEVTWNDGNSPFAGASGGGISGFFPIPDYQSGIKMPANANNDGKVGRGVPDVAGNASPFTGYIIRVHGSDTMMGGTSAVAPLYAALTMRINGALGRPVGFLNPFLYKNAEKGIFKDITDGNNNGYDAGPGWDAPTGWGSIRGDKLLEEFRKQDKERAAKELKDKQ